MSINEENKEAAFLESLFKNEPQKLDAPKPIEKSNVIKKENYYTLSEHEDGKLKLFVGGLYFQNEDDLSDYFSQYGKIISSILIKDKNTGRSRGFAFVTIEDLDGFVRKKIESQKHVINGKFVDVKLAEADKRKIDILNNDKKIFVGGLDISIDANDLRKFFNKEGEVLDSIVLKDTNTNISRGFGFVTFSSSEIAQKCVDKNNYEIKGRKIELKRAEPKFNISRQSRTYPIIPSQNSEIDLNIIPQNMDRPFMEYYSTQYFNKEINATNLLNKNINIKDRDEYIKYIESIGYYSESQDFIDFDSPQLFTEVNRQENKGSDKSSNQNEKDEIGPIKKKK